MSTIIVIIDLSCNTAAFIILWVQDAVKIMQDVLESNRTLKDVFPLVEKICVDMMEKNYNSATYMCPGLIYSYGPVVSG